MSIAFYWFQRHHQGKSRLIKGMSTESKSGLGWGSKWPDGSWGVAWRKSDHYSFMGVGRHHKNKWFVRYMFGEDCSLPFQTWRVNSLAGHSGAEVSYIHPPIPPIISLHPKYWWATTSGEGHGEVVGCGGWHWRLYDAEWMTDSNVWHIQAGYVRVYRHVGTFFLDFLGEFYFVWPWM